jgi:hypothetical protein
MWAHPLDQLAAVGGDSAARLGGGRVVAIGLDPDLWKKLRGIGVEPEANLAAALVDERRQPVGELRYLSRL